MKDRIVVHCDMNNFYASVECLYRPEIRALPVAVCGDPAARHGIILAKNERAKSMGVKTAQTIWQARQKCPDLHLILPNYTRYRRFSRMANEIYAQYTDRVEPFSIDESWLDLTGCVSGFDEGVKIAHRIRTRIKTELGVTVSIGVSFNKVFAKLGSDLKKPDAVTPIDRENFRRLLYPLPCDVLLFVGRATHSRLRRVNIHTVGDVANAPPAALYSLLGKWGLTLHRFANGLDETPVLRYGDATRAKGVGNSTTLPYDIISLDKAKPVLFMLCESVGERMRQANLWGRTLALWLRYSDLSGAIRQSTLPCALNNSTQMASHALSLLHMHWHGRPLRGLGVRMTNLTSAHEGRQLSLFEEQSERLTRLDRCIDTLRARFGHRCIGRAVCLAEPELYINPVEDNTVHPMPFYKQPAGGKEIHHA